MATKQNMREYPVQVIRENLRQHSARQAALLTRYALERCICSGSARLRYHWRDGRVTDTCFRRTAPGRIRVSGLLAEPVLRAAS